MAGRLGTSGAGTVKCVLPESRESIIRDSFKNANRSQGLSSPTPDLIVKRGSKIAEEVGRRKPV